MLNLAVIVLWLILIFAVIHLIVSISIIDQDRDYGGIFRPEVGLSAFNVVIGILGILVAAVALFFRPTNQLQFNKLLGIVFAILAGLTLISLITALIINSKSATYAGYQFTRKMETYASEADDANLVDYIQQKYDCCGYRSWLDWALVGAQNIVPVTTAGPIVTTESTSTAAPIVTTMPTSTAAPIVTTVSISTAAPIVTTVSTSPTSAAVVTTLPVVVVTTTAAAAAGKRSVRQKRGKQSHPAVKRQTSLVSGGFGSYSYTINTAVPLSCCANGVQTSTCISSSSDQFYQDGCARSLIARANRHDMGIAVINCFLLVFLILAIPLLWFGNQHSSSGENTLFENRVHSIDSGMPPITTIRL